MPINLFNNPLSSIKLGADNILKGYIGNSQIFPNDTEITAAAFTNSNIANTGGNTPYVVTGDIGSSFTLTGSNGAIAPSGTQVISSSPATYQIAIEDQSTICGSSQRNAQVVIAAQGNTILTSGLNNTDTIVQAAGPPNVSNTTTLSVSITNTNRVTVTQGSSVLWAPGASFSVNISVVTQQTLGSITLTPNPAIGNWTITNGGFTPQAWNSGTAGVNLVWDGSNAGLNGVSGTANVTIPAGATPMTSFSASLTIGNINCYSATQTNASDTIFP
jgi:hypothetical protein